MKPIPTYIAKAKLSELMRRALDGEAVYIGKGREAIVQLVPIGKKKKRTFGSMAGSSKVSELFFDALSEEELKAWET